jgi:hypothetical protein
MVEWASYASAATLIALLDEVNRDAAIAVRCQDR